MPLLTVNYFKPCPTSAPLPQALSVDPINPHILELLNIALESWATSLSVKNFDSEFKQTLKSKYTSRQDKGKAKAHVGVSPSNDISTSVSTSDEMNIG